MQPITLKVLLNTVKGTANFSIPLKLIILVIY